MYLVCWQLGNLPRNVYVALVCVFCGRSPPQSTHIHMIVCVCVCRYISALLWCLCEATVTCEFLPGLRRERVETLIGGCSWVVVRICTRVCFRLCGFVSSVCWTCFLSACVCARVCFVYAYWFSRMNQLKDIPRVGLLVSLKVSVDLNSVNLRMLLALRECMSAWTTLTVWKRMCMCEGCLHTYTLLEVKACLLCCSEPTYVL